MLQQSSANTAPKMSLSKGSSGSEFSVDNLYFTSVGSLGSRLYSNLKSEYFVEECLLARWAKSTPSIIDGHFNGLSSNNFLLFCFAFQLSHWIVGDRH